MLTQALEDEAWDVRRVAVTALGEQGERVPLDVLTQALEDDDSSVRSAVIT
jgi:HEAT repeat protein